VEPDPAPTPIPGRFKSWVQLRAWASHRFPRATLVTEGLGLKAWNRIAPILDGLASDWPGVANELGWITTRHPLWEADPRRTIAAAESTFGEKIAFNPFYFANPRMMAKAAKDGERDRAYPRGAKEAKEWYFVSHEWGHLVSAWLRRFDLERWLRLMALFREEPDNPQSAFDPTKVAAISQYATSRLTDAFAEAFSVLKWQDEAAWGNLIERFSRILRGKS
jgi:hypothetical protein